MAIPHQPELFPPTVGFRPDTAFSEPQLWVKELRVYRVLSPGDSNILRRISLRPGLNVLWARPGNRGRTAQLHVPGVSGHGTGKTSFCRFIRHVLGEQTFGNDEQRTRLRIAFPEGWIVAEVRLAGESWLVLRPFKIGSHSYCFRGKSIVQLFENEDGKVTFDVFTKALNAALIEPLGVVTFATDETLIGCQHLLQWLARDQECRYATLTDFRHSSSESQAPEMAVEDRHFLFRALLQLIDTQEQSELENNKKLLGQRQRAEKQMPLFRFRADSALMRLREELSAFRTDLAGSDFLDAAAKEWHRRADEYAQSRDLMAEPEELRVARLDLVAAQGQLNASELRADEYKDMTSFIEQQLKVLRGEASEADLDAFVQSKFKPDQFCGQRLTTAIEWECPLAKGRILPIEKTADPTAPTEPDLMSKLVEAKLTAEKHAVLVAAARKNVTDADSALRRRIREFDGQRGSISEAVATSRAWASEAERARVDSVEAEKLERSLDGLDRRIRESQDRQAALRQQNSARLSEFSDTFARIAQAILGSDVRGTIRFRGRHILPGLENRIELSSAALETLKILCFDLAALVSGVEGRGLHPRFLLHDSPREADMDAELYHRIFLLAGELEMAFGERPLNFQYIVTTTEPPPEGMRQAPWLIDPVLSAATSAEKYLGADY